MIRDLFTSGYACGVHIYTLNREVAPTYILKKLGDLILYYCCNNKLSKLKCMDFIRLEAKVFLRIFRIFLECEKFCYLAIGKVKWPNF